MFTVTPTSSLETSRQLVPTDSPRAKVARWLIAGGLVAMALGQRIARGAK